MKLSLKACRVNVNATVKEEAEYIGVCEDTVLNWEKGKTSPRRENVIKLLDFFASKGFYITVNDIRFLP